MKHEMNKAHKVLGMEGKSCLDSGEMTLRSNDNDNVEMLGQMELKELVKGLHNVKQEKTMWKRLLMITGAALLVLVVCNVGLVCAT